MKLLYLILFTQTLIYVNTITAQTSYTQSPQRMIDNIDRDSIIHHQNKYDSIIEYCLNEYDSLLHNIRILETSDFNRYLKGKVKTNTVNFYSAEMIGKDFQPIILLGKEIYKMNDLGQEVEISTYSETEEYPFKVVKNEYTKEGLQNKVTTYIDGELQKTQELISKDNQSLCYTSNADVYREEYGVIANSKTPNKILRASVEYTFKNGKLITRKKFDKKGEENIINRYFYDKEFNMIRMEESTADDNPRIITFKYLTKDDKGNWTKCYLTNTQNGEIQHQLIITRELEYY